jgi:hypothetical protein
LFSALKATKDYNSPRQREELGKLDEEANGSRIDRRDAAASCARSRTHFDPIARLDSLSKRAYTYTKCPGRVGGVCFAEAIACIRVFDRTSLPCPPYNSLHS